VSVEVLDESGSDVDLDAGSLAGLARFVLDRMRMHPATEMCLRLVDEGTIETLNRQWMDAEGPTDVLAFPMDELTPGDLTDEPAEGYLGDIALCPQVAARQAPEHRHQARDEIDLLCVHGILHLLGYDHAEPEEHQEMFGLQTRLLAEWQGVREGQPLRGTTGPDGPA
jgi:probable rRNA maturation factor